MKSITVTTPDGLHIAVQEWGNPNGPEILFIHGFCQSHLSWIHQVTNAELAAEFRMVTYDLRGHGGSDKPAEAACYHDGRSWAEELAAVIAGLRRPVLVGWSYGGRVISDYLRRFGDAGIAGIDFVAAVTRNDGALLGPGLKYTAGMSSSDLATNIAATKAFARACFERQPAQDLFDAALAYSMMVPANVRALLRDRPANPGDVLATVKVPVLVTQGEKDVMILEAMSRFTASQIKGAKLSVYPGVGHSPFCEDAPRFNRELTELVRAANGR
jgi:pimeloyl-ACP methyl ester carboxylesterase